MFIFSFVDQTARYFISIGMRILSDPNKDSVALSEKPGGYKWWYFDAIDSSSGYSLVVIFYLGNPFSNRYIRALNNDNLKEESTPENFPAVSISVYKEQKPVYYSFTEFDKANVRFSEKVPSLEIGNHGFDLNKFDEWLDYRLQLSEELPSGDRIQASLNFKSSNKAVPFDDAEGESRGHAWNLLQPRAEVQGTVRLYQGSDLRHDINFRGPGYHDHNTGQEPMKDKFEEWYWGRFHFPEHTLVYYVINRKEEPQYRAWLMDRNDLSIAAGFREFELRDKGRSLFGLHTARKLWLSNDQSQILVQQNQLLDNGPFYQRYLSDAFLYLEYQDVQKVRGISEYIRPERVYWRVFWPFVDMRIRYKNEKPHWVQKSKRLYRWTW